MSREVSRMAVLLVVLIVGELAGCQLLPERCAVNAPVRHLLTGKGVDPPSEEEVRDRMRVPDGFEIALFAEGIRNPRMLEVTPTGDLLVSTPGAGEVVLIERDEDGDGRADGRRTLIEGLDRPHGLALRDGWLYVAEGGAIGRIRFDPQSRATDGSLERIAGIPDGGNHWSRQIAFGPDGLLYLSVGSSCNVCEEEDPRRAAMLRYQPDGSEPQIYATGLRNTVGFDWQPASDKLFGTDNGRDLLGDDIPPCELNEIVEGAFYGWPIAHGDRMPDPDFGVGKDAEISTSRPPAHSFRAHNAPLGMQFLSGPGLPNRYRGAALVALHGSWNRTKKDGYKVVSLHWDDRGRITERDFATGFLVDEDVTGRPVDVAEDSEGTIYVSDDYAGSIWRIAHEG